MEAKDNQSVVSQVATVVNIPGYEIKEVLGRGGMATVYLAEQQSIGRQVALKVLYPDHSDPSFSDRFLREARIISKLAHPNIITIYDAGIHQGCHYMSMEYIAGKNLREARDKLTRKHKIAIIKQVAQALDFAGGKGYVHRDIKPENVMLHSDGRAILTDFGIARGQETQKGLTQTGKTIGTPYYMSPEQTKGLNVDHRSDIYSLGVVLFQALAGYVPYDGPSVVALGIKHISDPIPPLPKGLEIFQPIINIAMSKDPKHRYQTAGEFLMALYRSKSKSDNTRSIVTKRNDY
jgi:serine/threonine protein kinase